MAELLVAIAIIAVVVVLVLPGMNKATQNIQLERARSNVFAAIGTARQRAVRDRTLVALHIFRDNEAYRVPHPQSTRPGSDANIQDLRWGGLFSESPFDFQQIPTGKITLRMEIPNVLHRDTAAHAVEFFWPADHDPLVLPEFVGVARPGTELDRVVDVSSEFGAAAGTVTLNFYEDFYIVFGEDGKLATVLVDYDVYYDQANMTVNFQQLAATDGSNNEPTFSVAGLCFYDMDRAKSLQDDGDMDPTDGDCYAYINRIDNRIMISPYTGLPLKLEATP